VQRTLETARTRFPAARIDGVLVQQMEYVAPVTPETAHEMIGEVRELELLRGFRNLPRGDCDALSSAIQAISMLAHVAPRTVTEAEINPLIVKAQGRGVVAVDGLVVFEKIGDRPRFSGKP
jgi:hypothetical protein